MRIEEREKKKKRVETEEERSKPGTGTVAGVRVIELSRSHGCRSGSFCDLQKMFAIERVREELKWLGLLLYSYPIGLACTWVRAYLI